MLLVIGGVDFFLGDDVVLATKLIELVILEGLIGVLKLGHSLLDGLLLVSLFFEHDSFSLKLSLELSRLGVEPIVESHSFS